MNVLSKEDREFLNNLQQELLTQDTVGQANPRFWVVRQEVRDYGVENNDGICIIEDGATCYEGDFSNVKDWLKEEIEEIKTIEYEGGYFDISYKNGAEYFFDFEEFESFLNECRPNRFYVGTYRDREEIVANTMFLTKRECEEHIKSNSHHYNKTAHSYAMTAWRSPQVEKLYKILSETDWQ